MSSKAIVCDPGKMTVQALYVLINAFAAFQSKISVVWCYKRCTLLELTPLVGPTLKNVVSPRVSKICQSIVVCGTSYSCFALGIHKPRAECVGCTRRGFFLRIVFKVVWWSYFFLMLSIWQATSHYYKTETGILDRTYFTHDPSFHTCQRSLFCARVCSPDQFLFLWPGCHPQACVLFILLIVIHSAVRRIHLYLGPSQIEQM